MVGSSFVSEGSEELKHKLGLPDADLWMVEPGSEEEVSELLQYANRHEVCVIPIGKGQQLHIGSTPKNAHILLSSIRLTGIVEHSVGDLTMTVKAGTPFSEVQAYLQQHDQFVPITPPTLAESTVGGLVATASNGPERVLYGSWRDNVIGLRVVYPNGQIVRTGGKVVKNVAGYDMNKLFVGSYGSLAYIIEITLKVRPYPKHRELVLALNDKPTELIQLASLILASECIPSALELIRRVENGTVSYCLAVGCDEVESAAKYQEERIRQLADEAGSGIQLKALIGRDDDQFWADERNNWKQTTPGSLTLRAGFPIPETARILDRYEKEASARNVILEYTVSLGTGTLRIRLRSKHTNALYETTSVLRELAELSGGYLVVEHGEPNLKKKLGVWGAIRGGLSLMQGIKETVDPIGILSPGRFVGGI
jgi:glycolate oxidase FAD binding subunit